MKINRGIEKNVLKLINSNKKNTHTLGTNSLGSQLNWQYTVNSAA